MRSAGLHAVGVALLGLKTVLRRPPDFVLLRLRRCPLRRTVLLRSRSTLHRLRGILLCFLALPFALQ